MNENYDDCHDRKTTRTFIYTLICSTWVSVLKKQHTLRSRIFNEIFEVGIYIQKVWHLALRDVFIYKKLDNSQKAR